VFLRSQGQLFAEAVSIHLPSGPMEHCFGDADKVGDWTNQYSGFGCDMLKMETGKVSLTLEPKAATDKSETHASLFTGPEIQGDVKISCNVTTLQQLRSGSAANLWEMGWVIWNYKDNDHFYYFVGQPNGWEIGKRDPTYKATGNQRFIDSGLGPLFPAGKTYSLKIEQTGAKIKVEVDGKVLSEKTDTENPYTSGAAGFYAEDSFAKYDSVSITGNRM